RCPTRRCPGHPPARSGTRCPGWSPLLSEPGTRPSSSGPPPAPRHEACSLSAWPASRSDEDGCSRKGHDHVGPRTELHVDLRVRSAVPTPTLRFLGDLLLATFGKATIEDHRYIRVVRELGPQIDVEVGMMS